MKYKDIIKYNYKTLKKEKRTTNTSIIIALSIVLILGVSTFIQMMFGYIRFVNEDCYEYSKMLNGYDMQIPHFAKIDDIEKHTNEFKKELLSDSNIIKYYGYDEKEYSTLIDELSTPQMEGIIILNSAILETLPIITHGDLKGFLEGETLICPQKYLGQPKYTTNNLSANDMIDMKQFLGHEFSINYGNKVKKIKLGGLYDSLKNFNDDNICFINSNSLKEINNYFYKDDEDYKKQASFKIFVKNYKVGKKLIEGNSTALERGYSIKSRMTLDYSEIAIYLILGIIIIGISIFFVIIFIFIYFKKNLINSTEEISILKSIGYKNSLIEKIKLCEMYMICFYGLIGGIVLYSVIFIMSKYFQNNINPIYLRLPINYSWISIILSTVGLIMIANLITKRFLKKIEKENIVNLSR